MRGVKLEKREKKNPRGQRLRCVSTSGRGKEGKKRELRTLGFIHAINIATKEKNIGQRGKKRKQGRISHPLAILKGEGEEKVPPKPYV